MIVLLLSQGAIAVIDNVDKAQAEFKWHLAIRGSCQYAVRRKDGKPVYLHREIMGEPPREGLKVDHRNGRGTDCRRKNLRWLSHRENLMNTSQPKSNTSGFKGVARKGKGWRAYITVQGKQINLGVFKTAKGANKARLKREREIYGISYRRRGKYRVEG